MGTIPKLTTAEVIALRPHVDRPMPTNTPLGVERECEPVNKMGDTVEVGTIFMVGAECRFHCVMCDLWKYTTKVPTQPGAIAAQVAKGLSELSAQDLMPSWLKLYNASNFFSTANVPSQDLRKIAEQVVSVERLIVENHPKLTSSAIVDFANQISGTLELAQGLETADAATLGRLNKAMTLEDFRRSCDWAVGNRIDVRAFVLLRPPGMGEQEGLEACLKAIDFAESAGCRHISVIPLRKGNGAVEHLQRQGLVELPVLRTLETLMQSVASFSSVVTADLWDWDSIRGHCSECSAIRRTRLEGANMRQVFPSESIAGGCSCDIL